MALTKGINYFERNNANCCQIILELSPYGSRLEVYFIFFDEYPDSFFTDVPPETVALHLHSVFIIIIQVITQSIENSIFKLFKNI